MKRIFMIIMIALSMAACGSHDIPQTPTDLYGQWNGPEGTYLKIGNSETGPIISIKDLDKEETYKGSFTPSGQIVFERNDIMERVVRGTGSETGMKWLMDRQDCLIIQYGEGYCR